jgi:hypothetical protein
MLNPPAFWFTTWHSPRKFALERHKLRRAAFVALVVHDDDLIGNALLRILQKGKVADFRHEQHASMQEFAQQ